MVECCQAATRRGFNRVAAPPPEHLRSCTLRLLAASHKKGANEALLRLGPHGGRDKFSAVRAGWCLAAAAKAEKAGWSCPSRPSQATTPTQQNPGWFFANHTAHQHHQRKHGPSRARRVHRPIQYRAPALIGGAGQASLPSLVAPYLLCRSCRKETHVPQNRLLSHLHTSRRAAPAPATGKT